MATFLKKYSRILFSLAALSLMKPDILDAAPHTRPSLANSAFNSAWNYIDAQWSRFERLQSLEFAENSDSPKALAALKNNQERWLNQALASLQQSLKLDPNSAYLHGKIGQVFAELEQYEQSALSVEKAIDLNPKEGEWYLLRGKLYSLKQQSQLAAQQYERCIQVDPTMEECYLFLSREYAWNQNHLDQAIKVLQNYLLLKPQSSSVKIELANLYTAQKNPKKAEAIYLQVLNENPDNLAALNFLGEVFFEQKDLKKALQYFLMLEEAKPTDLGIQLKLGILYYELEDYARAIRNFQKAQQINPKDERLFYYLGLLHALQKNYPEALSSLKKVSLGSELYSQAQLRMILVYGEMGRTAEALRLAQKVFKKNKESVELYELLGNLYTKQKKFPEALHVLEEGIQKYGQQESLLFNKGVLLHEMGREEESYQWMRQVLKINPENVQALNYLGYSYAESGKNLEEALQLTEKAHQLAPDDAYILDSFAWAHFKSGHTEKALELLKKANQLKPSEPEILSHLGDVYKKLGQKKKAQQYYREALTARNKMAEKMDPEDLKALRLKLREIQKEN